MTELEKNDLSSAYLLDIRTYFDEHRRALSSKGCLEFEEEPHELITDELWEVVLWLHSDVYLTLTVWGDALATFVVRESCKKRMHRLLLRVHDFPLLAPPEDIFDSFKYAAQSLYLLGTPPGTAADQGLLDELRTRWLSISSSELH